MLQIFKNPILCLNLADRLILHIGHIGFHRFVDLEGQHIGLAVEFQKPFVPETVQNLVGIVIGFLNRLCRLFQDRLSCVSAMKRTKFWFSIVLRRVSRTELDVLAYSG